MSETATKKENPVFGRKIFFITPPPNVFPFVTNKLRELEYEVYVIPNWRFAREILKKYPNSICFINIDEQSMSSKGWLSYIKSINEDEDENLKSTIMGVLSSRSRRTERELFLSKVTLDAGYIVTSVGNSELVNSIQGVLDVNGAKGRRQYVRANTSKNPTAQIICEVNENVLTMQLLDISTVGFACGVSNKEANCFVKNALLKNFTLRLEKRQILSSAVVFAIKPGETFTTLVLLFLPNQLPQNKIAIQEFIAKTLEQSTLGDISKNFAEDRMDYESLYNEDKA